MRFSIQEDGKAKMFFHIPADAQKATGLHFSLIKTILKRNNFTYHRKSDNKLFFIKKEPAVKILTVQGKDFFSLEEIQQEFSTSPTKFMNQIKNQKFPHKIDWISPEISSPGTCEESEAKSEMKKEESETKQPSETKPGENQNKTEIESLREKVDFLSSRVLELEKEKEEEKRKREQTREKVDFLSSRVLKLEKEKEERSRERSNLSEQSRERNQEQRQEKKAPSPAPEKINSEEKIPFDTSKKFARNTFESAATFAKFIRYGIIGRINQQGPKKHNTITLDGKLILVPDLLKELITKHIKDFMFKQGDEESKIKFMEAYIMMPDRGQTKAEQKKYSGRGMLVGKIRRCDEETIDDISKEFMKLI